MLLDASTGKRSTETRLTRLFSGKPARALVNDYLHDFLAFDDVTTLPPYPQLNAMAKTMRAEAIQHKDAEYQSLWAGQGVALVKRETTAELLNRLVQAL